MNMEKKTSGKQQFIYTNENEFEELRKSMYIAVQDTVTYKLT